jgi:hypothetical protein
LQEKSPYVTPRVTKINSDVEHMLLLRTKHKSSDGIDQLD